VRYVVSDEASSDLCFGHDLASTFRKTATTQSTNVASGEFLLFPLAGVDGGLGCLAGRGGGRSWSGRAQWTPLRRQISARRSDPIRISGLSLRMAMRQPLKASYVSSIWMAGP
jgi:hypothetical protein